MQYLPAKWDVLLDWWYHQQHPEVRGMLVDSGIMNRLQFGVPKRAGRVHKQHVGIVTVDHVAKVSPKIYRKIKGFDRVTMAFLADVLRFSKRRTPGGWSKKTKPPVLSAAA